MKKIFWLTAIIFLFSFQILYASNINIINNQSNGFQAVIDGKNILIDRSMRDFSNHEIIQKNNLIYIKYLFASRIPKIGLIIIKNNTIVFDSKNKIEIDGHPYMEKIYNNYIYYLRSIGSSPGPELYGYNPMNGRKFDENDYTYKTQIENGKIFIDINFDSTYKQFIRLQYDNNYRLCNIINFTGIIANNKYPIAIIIDPDGYTNVRSGPGKQYPIIEKVFQNNIFSILHSKGEWSYILTASSKTGYMHKSRIKIINY